MSWGRSEGTLDACRTQEVSLFHLRRMFRLLFQYKFKHDFVHDIKRKGYGRTAYGRSIRNENFINISFNRYIQMQVNTPYFQS